MKRVTIKEIAKTLKLSISTVSRALNDHPSIGLATRKRIQEMAREMKYERNQSAVFFQQGKTFNIGVILPDLGESFFSAAISAIEETAFKRNYLILSAQTQDDTEKEIQMVEKMRTHRVDGIIASVCKGTTDFAHFEMLKDYDIPVVFFDRIPPLKNIHYVTCNIVTGALEAVSFLLRKGHRVIGLINGPETLSASTEREEGYKMALAKNRLKFDPQLITHCDLSERDTGKALEQLLEYKRKPTAIVTFNDYVCYYAVNHLREMQLPKTEHPEFVSFANLPITHYMNLPLSASVEQFPRQQAAKATEILLDLLSKKENQSEEATAYFQITIDSELREL